MLKHKPTPFCFVFLIFSKKWEGNQICKASGGFGSSSSSAHRLTRWNEPMELSLIHI